MKRVLCMLCALLLLPLAACASAPSTAPREMFVAEQVPANLPRPNEWAYEAPASLIQAGDAWYGLYSMPQTILRWQQDSPELTLFAQLPVVPEGLPYPERPAQEQQLMHQQAYALFEHQGKPYALNAYSGRFGPLGAEGVLWQDVQLDLSAVVDVNSGYLESPLKLVAVGNQLLLAMGGYSPQLSLNQLDLHLFALDSGKASKLDLPLVVDVAPYQAGQLLLLRYREEAHPAQQYLAVLDVQTGALRELPLALPDRQLGGLAYDAQTDTIYYVDKNLLYVSVAGAAFAAANVLPSDDLSRAVGFAQQGGYALFNHSLRVGPLRLGEGDSYLKLRLFQGASSPLVSGFQAAHPQANILVDDGSLSAQQVLQQQLAEPAGTDIWELRVDAQTAALYDKGYAADLSADPALQQALEGLYPWAMEALLDQAGALRGVPSHLEAPQWLYNAQQFEQHFPGEALPETWQQLLQLLIRFEESADEYPDHSFISMGSYSYMLQLMLQEYVRQYAAQGSLQFDRPQLLKALTLWQQARQIRQSKGLSLEAINYDAYGFDSGSQEPTIFFPGTSYNSLLSDPQSADETASVTKGMLPPRFEGEAQPQLRAVLQVLVLNPHSKNKEAAIDFLRYAASREADPRLHILLHPDSNQPIEDPAFPERLARYQQQLADVQQSYDQAEGVEKQNLLYQLNYAKAITQNPQSNRYLVSPAGIVQYRRLASYLQLYPLSPYVLSSYQNPVDQLLHSLCTRFGETQMPVEEFVKGLNQSFWLIEQESR